MIIKRTKLNMFSLFCEKESYDLILKSMPPKMHEYLFDDASYDKYEKCSYCNEEMLKGLEMLDREKPLNEKYVITLFYKIHFGPGSRGTPFLYQAIAREFSNDLIKDLSREEFTLKYCNAYKKYTGRDLYDEGYFYVTAFDHGGLKGGKITAEFFIHELRVLQNNFSKTHHLTNMKVILNTRETDDGFYTREKMFFDYHKNELQLITTFKRKYINRIVFKNDSIGLLMDEFSDFPYLKNIKTMENSSRFYRGLELKLSWNDKSKNEYIFSYDEKFLPPCIISLINMLFIIFDKNKWDKSLILKNYYGDIFKEYIVCYVKFNEDDKEYCYLTEDETIKSGDYVWVPTKYNDCEIAKVSRILKYEKENLPYSLEKMKYVDGKVKLKE